MRIPSKKQCYELIHEMEMMEHIVAHSIQVWRVASFLTDHITKHEVYLNPELIQASALLHDITKTRSFKTGENHALTGKELLTGMGYPEVGDIIGQHVVLDAYFESETPTEAEIVNYADKRVLHDKVALLEERMNYILEKYGNKPELRERIRWLGKKTKQQEDRIFSYMPFSPGELGTVIPEDCADEISAYHEALSD
ncbi:HD domain-containing protein [Desulfonema magnum]|uniref:HDIG domain-containing protein n=1 Tax=Desulfonema magnum TaxID=45655 RepID=A0A975GSR0_9BACT|nr:HD domain-containing protein [Desulfonema magnum]QTA92309.1 HDIG domain-containing protein [Desulfonema magnum]